MEHINEYLLAVHGNTSINMKTLKLEYNVKVIVSQSVYDWLLIHDIELHSTGERLFVCNNVKYLDLGPVINTKKDD